MPVLTCPFTAIPAQGVPAASTLYPATGDLATELAIKPTATETWSVEGLSIDFTAGFTAAYQVNIKKAYANLKEQIKNIEEVVKRRINQIFSLGEKLKWNEEEVSYAELTYSRATLERPGTEQQAAAAAALQAARANVQATKAEIESVRAEQEVSNKEINILKREQEEVGHQTAREGLRNQPLTITARMYARGNELVWNAGLTPLQQLVSIDPFVLREKAGVVIGTILTGEWGLTINTHVQFDDPIDFTERENLKLVLEFSGPAEIKELEGSFEGSQIATGINLSQVQAVVNYSRQVAS